MTTAAQILARSKQAAGGDAWGGIGALYRRWEGRKGGTTGALEEWDDLTAGRYVTVHSFGLDTGRDGFDGTAAWSQDGAGQVRPEEGDDAREAAANRAYRACLAYWFPERWPALVEKSGRRCEGDRRFSVLRITPEGGRPFDLWMTRQVWLIGPPRRRHITRRRFASPTTAVSAPCTFLTGSASPRVKPPMTTPIR